MRLEVLRLLVLRNVLEQRGLVDEAFVARVTLVRLVRLVTSVNESGRKKQSCRDIIPNQSTVEVGLENAPRVALQVGQLAEGLCAAGVPALVGLVARVRPDVLLEVGELRELALTDLASERRRGGVRNQLNPFHARCWECARHRAAGTANVTQIVPQKSSIGSADVQGLIFTMLRIRGGYYSRNVK